MAERQYIPGVSVTGEQIAAAALRYVGTPYRWSGHRPATGLDCVGLVDQAHADCGLTPRQLYNDGVWPWTVDHLVGHALWGRTNMAGAQVGDTLVFALGGEMVHVGVLTDVQRGLMVSALVPRAAQTTIGAVRPEALLAIVCSGVRVAGNVVNPVIPPPPSRTYTVRPGDTLSGIAARFGYRSWTTLYARNVAVIGLNPRLIRPGQVLNV